MTCREFVKKVEDFRLTELSSEAELFAHQNGCASCTAWLQQRNALAGAMQALRSRTSGMEAPAVVEQNVLRAFRQSSATKSAIARRAAQSASFRLSHLLGWRAYAAALLAVCLGLGLWFAQRPTNPLHHVEPHQSAQTEQAEQASEVQPASSVQVSQVPIPATQRHTAKSANIASNPPREAVSTAPVARTEQAQGYTPLMLCDPISCSGDQQIVRMELPPNPADGSAGSQMADVIVGDDGLVRAIRIVQQQ
jgi:hypothetical protein